MPPSPAMRCSPGRELRGDNHKRGRSLEGGVFYRERDEDLALFSEMETRERDNFLLQSTDDFDDILSTKLRYFSSNKLGISIPARGESSDMLNADGEKNDYDWLLTPPDTPLFRSLDDEMPPVALAQRGRPLSKPITISRSSTMEKSYRSSRGSASPNRLSPSPRSGNNSIQLRGRPSSAPHSSPTPSVCQSTPSRRPSPNPSVHQGTPSRRSSPPQSKPSTPAPRSSTPTSSRMSTGPGGTVSSSGRRGASPVNTRRGNSASPKIKAWQKNIPGFSLDPPPNLRTSLGDRPASYVRGSSPASRNGRQSMSPTASRSVSSSYSHDRDRYSSHSKGSIASSGDDDVDSLQSVPINSSGRTTSGKVGAYSSNKAPAFSRKSTRAGLSSSAPKRSFDSALRQMDHRKGPQNMFRPLLSSVPSSTFYVGKSTAAHHTLISRNSSVTTSSNASSDQATTGAHDTEGSDLNQDDIGNTYGKAPYTDVEDDIFTLEKTDSVSEDINPVVINGGGRVDFKLGGSSQNFDCCSSPMVTNATSEVLDAKSKFLEINGVEDGVICSECGRSYPALELKEGDLNLCTDCRSSDEPMATTSSVPTILVSEISRSFSMKNLDDFTSYDAVEPLTSVPGSSGLIDLAVMSAAQNDENFHKNHTPYAEPSLNLSTYNSSEQKVIGEDVQRTSNQLVIDQPTIGHSSSDDGNGVRQIHHFSEFPNLKLDVSEGTGISILLKRSSSGKGPVVRSRTFTATSIPFDELSYVRDCAPSMRSSSSSVDINTKHQRSGSSLSGTSSHAFHGLGISTSTFEENAASTLGHDENEVGTCNSNVPPEEQSLASVSSRFDDICTEVVCNDRGGMVTNTLNTTDSAESSVASFSNIEDSASYGNGEDFQNDTRSISDGGDGLVSTDVDMVDLAEIATHSPLETISEIEIENGHPSSPGSQSDVGSPNSSNNLDELQEPSVSTRSNEDVAALIAEHDSSDHVHGILEESTVTVDYFETKAGSLTLEEATDTVLFCSSIVHNLAYEAATIAIEKENSRPLEGSRPVVTILGNSNSDRKEPRGRTTSKRTSKSQKPRKRRVEMEMNPPSGKDLGDGKFEISTTRIVGAPDKSDIMKPPKLESKCNCAIM